MYESSKHKQNKSTPSSLLHCVFNFEKFRCKKWLGILSIFPPEMGAFLYGVPASGCVRQSQGARARAFPRREKALDLEALFWGLFLQSIKITWYAHTWSVILTPVWQSNRYYSVWGLAHHLKDINTVCVHTLYSVWENNLYLKFHIQKWIWWELIQLGCK